MSKLNRILWTGLVLGIAACGDDVTVTQPPEPPAPGIRSVTVAPDGITLAINGTAQMTAAVVTDPGATGTPTITWGSSNQTVATVSATGLVTAKAAGSVGITATAVLGTSTAQGVATVTVVAASANAPTVSINSVLQGQSTSCVAAGTPGLPVDLANAACQLDVVLNLERNGNKVDSLVLQVDGKTVAKQAFSASAPVDAAAPELTIENATLSFNTANFNATTGAVDFLNGSHLVQAKVYSPATTTGPAASNTIAINFNNASFWATTIKVINGSSANSSTGLLWQTGDLEATSLPVVYVPGTVTIQQAVFSGCGLPAQTVTAAPYKATWLKVTTTAAISAAGIENPNCVVNVASTVNNNPGPNGASNSLRYDNAGPAAPIVNENPNGRQAGWLNDAVSFTAAASGTSPDRSILTTFADAGVGGTIWRGRVGATLAAAIASSDISNMVGVAASATGTSYCLVLYGIDALGNRSANPTACDVGDADNNTLVGLDRAPPTIGYTAASLADQNRLNGVSIGGEFIVNVVDTGAVGNSGVLQPVPVLSNVIRRTAAGTSFSPAPGDCVQGTVAGTPAACTQSSVGLTVPPNVSTAITALNIAGYYTHTATAKDGAGNSTVLPGGAVIVYDFTPVTVQAPSVPAVITGPFSSAAFLNDDLSIRDYFWTVTYATALVAPTSVDLGAPTVVDPFNAPTLSNINYGVNATVSALLALQATAANVPQAFAPAANLLSSVALSARDQTQAAYTASAATPIAPSGLVATSGIPLSGGAGATAWTFNTYTPATTNATVCAGTLVGGCGATAISTVFTAKAAGTTGTFNNPFGRVDFYAANAAGTRLVLIGSVPAGSATADDAGGVTRTWTYSLSMSASTLYGMLGGVSPAVVGPVNVYALGVKSTGLVALVSGAVAQTINP